MISAAQYIRMSTSQQRYSLQVQSEIIGSYASANGYKIVQSYEDAGRSGLTIQKRPGLMSLLADVTAGPPFSAILVLDVSRWGRYQDPDEAAHYEFLCRESGVQVRYCAENFGDEGSAVSAVMKGVKRVMAAEYSRQLSDRVKAGRDRCLSRGSSLGGRTPYGFARSVVEMDGSSGSILAAGERTTHLGQGVRIVWGAKAEVTVVQRIFDLFVNELLTPTQIARQLDGEGVPNPGSGGWEEDRVKRVLTNELVIGVRTFGQTQQPLGGKRRRIKRADWGRVQVLEPMVSVKTFSSAQSLLEKAGGYRYSNEHLIKLLIRLHEKNGYLSRRLVDGDQAMPNAVTYVTRFGSMREAFLRAGYMPTIRRGEHTEPAGLQPAEIVVRLKALLEKWGYLSAALIKGSPGLPDPTSIRRRFGSLETAYRLAGYDESRGAMLKAAWTRRRARSVAKALSGSASPN